MQRTKQKALIIGAGVAGQELAEEINHYLKSYYNIVGFVDDMVPKTKRQVGKKILGTIQDIPKLIKRYGVDEVLIAIPSAQGQTIRQIVTKCKGSKVSFKIVPRSLEIVLGKVHLGQIRPVMIEDLLGRSIIQAEQSKFLEFFKNKVVMVTGAAGSIGSELCRQIIEFAPKKVIGYDWWENGLYELKSTISKTPQTEFELVLGNIQEYQRLKKVMKLFQPDIIFHAAAFKQVPLMQQYPEEAIKNNVFGTYNIAKVAYEQNVQNVIFISSDKAANPSSIMGATKLIGEKIMFYFNARRKTKYCAVRFGNVLGSNGSVVPIFKKQIGSGGPVTVTDPDMVRYFMTTPEAVQLLLEAPIIGGDGEIYILDMGEQIKIYDLAELMIILAGFRPNRDINIEFVGIRNGEKLSESLASEHETLQSTRNQKILRIAPIPQTNSDTKRLIRQLRLTIASGNNKELFDILMQLAPNLHKLQK